MNCEYDKEGLRDTSELKEHVNNLIDKILRIDALMGSKDPVWNAVHRLIYEDHDSYIKATAEYIRQRYGALTPEEMEALKSGRV